MTDGWSIGPDVASLEVKAVAGLPVSWILTPLPDNWTPITPVFNVSLPNDVIKSFPLTYGPLDGEDVWYVILTGEQTEELKHAAYVQLVDSGYPIAAGRYLNLTGWSPNVTPVSMPARIIGAPIVGGPGGSAGGLSLVDNGDGTLTLTDTAGQVVDNGDGTLTLTV